MKKIDGKNVYEVSLPLTTVNPLVRVTHPESTHIAFGIHTVEEVVTNSGPGMLVKGTDRSDFWGDPKFVEFLVDVGEAKPAKRAGIACFRWRDQYWVRAVRPDRKAAQTYAKSRDQGRIVQYILLPVTIESPK